ncbi:nucleosome assembly protein 1-like 1 isoform X2 [Atheta coriaria]|uniref:nucleosome assembly protein 1-like 1 isoform X2 n=1 Tax=Dalotia coriaria TaxID=877792 RepID=UPI0031F418F0
MPENEHVGDCGEDVEEVEEEEAGEDRALTFPDVLAALQQQRLMMLSLPPKVKRRVRALKKLQLEQTNIEAKFFDAVHELECKYHQLYLPLYEKRQTIISGAYEPNEDECDYHSDEDEELAKETEEKVKIEDAPAIDVPKMDENAAGIPDFWLTIFKNIALLAEMVQTYDEPILKHLKDIKTKFIEKPMGFTLEFHFEPNEFFTNTVLTKEYDMKCVPDPEDPFGFEGPEIYKCRGCQINWNKGKNVTLKLVRKKQKHKSRGLVRTITKTIQNDSFFNFFSPPTIPDDINADDVDEELRELLTTDFEIGHYMRERVVPKAVLYYTGEAIDDEEYDDEEDDDEDEEDSEEEEDDSDAKENAKNVKDQNCKQQ